MSFQRTPELIQWHEGMPLLPQHFQQLNLRFENLLNNYFSVIDSNNYGIIQIDIDLLQLIRNQFSVPFIEAIMQDGQYVCSGSATKEKLCYTLPGPSDDAKQKIALYLCAPKYMEKNYLLGHYPRYVTSEKGQVEDLNTLSDPVDIPSLAPNIFLAQETELNSNLNYIKISELHIENGAWQVLEYIPAPLFITKTSKLYKLCVQVAKKARVKVNMVSEILNGENQLSQISENYLFLMSINQVLPCFEALLGLDKINPHRLYLALCQFFGTLGILNESYIAQPPLAYEHQNLLKVFEKIIDGINSLLYKGISEHFTSVLFENAGYKYILDISSNKLKENMVYIGSKRNAADNDTNVIEWLENATICCASKLDLFIKNRVLGFKRKKLEKHPQIVPGRGVLLFEIELEGRTANDFKLCIFNDNKNKMKPDDIYFYLKK